MAVIDKTYHRHLVDILEKGYTYEDPNRDGVIRTELPSVSIRHELSDGFPTLTTKKTFFRGAVAELLFFLSGSTDIRDLWDRGVNFWDKDWARYKGWQETTQTYLKDTWKKRNDEPDEDYDMGRIYPAQYRDFAGRVDQIAKVVKILKYSPMSTYMVVNAWNPDELDDMALAPCHYGFQIVGRPLTIGERSDAYFLDKEALEDGLAVEEVHYLLDKYDAPKYGFEIHWQQRSTDYFLGTPINIQYYALLAHLLEQITGHKALAVVGDMKKVHLYDNQIEQVKELLTRDVNTYSNTPLVIGNYLVRVREEGHYNGENLDEILEGIQVDDFNLFDYKSYPPLKAEMLTKDS